MPTRRYLNGISKSYKANRTFEGFVQRPSEFHFITRHVLFALCCPLEAYLLHANFHSKTGVCHQENQMSSGKLPMSSCDSSWFLSKFLKVMPFVQAPSDSLSWFRLTANCAFAWLPIFVRLKMLSKERWVMNAVVYTQTTFCKWK